MVVLVGSPAGGKTTLRESVFEAAGYVVVNRDTRETPNPSPVPCSHSSTSLPILLCSPSLLSTFIAGKLTKACRPTVLTPKRCLDTAKAALAAGKSVVVDNTSPEAKTRATYLALATQAHIPARCIHLTTSKPLAFHLNWYRTIQTGGKRERLPSIALHMFFKK